VPIAVALDARGAAAAGEWIRAAAPTYPCLLDERHTVAELYGMVNVPMAVWIDESGAIVRPAEIAGASEAFRTELDRETFAQSERGVERVVRAREVYSAAVRAWVLEGRHALPPDEARRRLRLPTATAALAAAHARLGELLWEAGDGAGARRHFAEASRLVPESWCFRRQAWNLEDSPQLADSRFWAAVDAVGTGEFYPEPPDLAARAPGHHKQEGT
jgi:hypothetical protein